MKMVRLRKEKKIQIHVQSIRDWQKIGDWYGVIGAKRWGN